MNVSVSPAAEIALRTLSDDGRQNVFAWIDHLRNWENDSFVREQSKKLKADDNVYVLKTSDDIRLFFRLEKDRIVVLDLATKATIVSFGQMTGTGS
jgi:mRNA-degrading endonuclease RelE of RelBE toxin-antitoxin system